MLLTKFAEILLLATPLKFFAQNLWRDEAFSWFMSTKSIAAICILSAKDFTPPLHYLILHYWSILFGASEIALRAPSLFAYGFTLYFAFDICLLHFKYSMKKSGLCVLLIALTPTLLYFAFEVFTFSEEPAFLNSLCHFESSFSSGAVLVPFGTRSVK